MQSPTPEFAIAGVALVIMLIFIIIGIVINVFYLLTLQKAISRCSPQNQAMAPGLVWLSLIPFFSIVWNFFVVINVAKSLGAEFQSRMMTEPEAPGKTIGLTMCILACCSILPIPIIQGLIGIGALVCWIIYWVQIAGFSAKLLETAPIPVE